MEKILELLLVNALVPALIFVLGWLAGRFIKPWIQKEPTRLERAEEIALIASRLTESIKKEFPNASWDDWLDSLSDRLIRELGLDSGVAKREAVYQLAKKVN